VVVAADGDDTARAIGHRVAAGRGVVGFVAASGQPIALRPTSTDARLADDVGADLGWAPGAVLAVPCAGDDGIVGVLELLAPLDGGTFDFDAVEDATLLAGVAAAALEASHAGASVPTPTELGGDLERLAVADPTRYVHVAGLVQALLDRG